MVIKYFILSLLFLINNITSADFILETARLMLRPFNYQDFNILYPLLSDPQVMAHSRDGALDIIGTKNYLDKRIIKPFIKQGWGRYALFNKFDGDFIGFCGLTVHTLDDNQEYVELGYKIIKKFWGQGYASEAAICIINYAKDVLGIKEIISIIEPSNLASIKIAQKVGLSFWKKSFFNNEIVDIYRAKFE
jgi:ribosomal-protein-alanine N-acetyltransferase